MALSSTVLAGLVRAKLLADADAHAVDNVALTALCKAVAEAVVEHVTAAAVVTVTVATTGTAVAQTGTGTGTVS